MAAVDDHGVDHGTARQVEEPTPPIGTRMGWSASSSSMTNEPCNVIVMASPRFTWIVFSLTQTLETVAATNTLGWKSVGSPYISYLPEVARADCVDHRPFKRVERRSGRSG